MNLTILRIVATVNSKDDFVEGLVLLILLEIIICITFLIGTILNAILVILFIRRRGFRTLSNR